MKADSQLSFLRKQHGAARRADVPTAPISQPSMAGDRVLEKRPGRRSGAEAAQGAHLSQPTVSRSGWAI